MAGVSASLQIMLTYVEHVALRVHSDDDGSTFAVIDVDGGHVTISGPADRVAATLRVLADKVDADSRSGRAVA